MSRPAQENRIDESDYASYLAGGLVSERCARPIQLNGQRGIEFEWQLSEKTSPVVRTAVIDYLSAKAYGNNYRDVVAYSDRTRTIGIILYGANAENFLSSNFSNPVRGK